MWPVERPHAKPALQGADDVPFKSMTYGQMPYRHVYDHHFNQIVGTYGGAFEMELTGADAELAYEHFGDPDFVENGKAGYAVRRDELWDFLEFLIAQWEDGNEAAGDFASSILTALHFEWI